MTELVWEGKYDKSGHKAAPIRVSLPFQTVEMVNETAQERQRTLDLFTAGRNVGWRNRLIWGDKKYILPALLDEFAGAVDLVYIDPPFATGADFTFQLQIGDGEFIKQPSVIEQKAYRDTWGRGLDSYLQWFYEAVVLLRDLLKETGSLYVHLDWHVAHYARAVLDEVFGRDNFLNEVVWYYYNKFQGNVNRFASNHDVIFWYRKGEKFKFAPQREKRPEGTVRQLKRVWDKDRGMLVNVKGPDGKVLYQETDERTVDDVWRISMLQPADTHENLRYPTQKPEALLTRIIEASSEPNDLVLDCFCGSGTTAAVAEKLGRRWIAADLSRFAIHTTRKRLLSIPDVKPFVVQNLGKYERQAWQRAEFSDESESRGLRYRQFILRLYNATPVTGYVWLHGARAGRMAHVGAVDAPVSPGDITQMIAEFKRAIGRGARSPTTNGIDILGWDFAFELNEVARQQAALANIDLRFFRIPRDVMDKRAVEQGDVKFFELAALSVALSKKGRTVTVGLKDFVIPLDDIPQDIQKTIKDWTEWIDYWAVDWDFRGDAFHNEWQTYRTRKTAKLERSVQHTYEQPGKYVALVKVIDILGNDTTKSLGIEIK